MTSGGFDHGDDFVAARVTIDIPTDGVAGLRELTQEMDRFRTAVEAGNRSSETFASYLQRIAEAANQAATAQQNLMSMLENSNDLQNRAATSGSGGPQPQLNAPHQYSDPFATSSAGMGMGGGAGGGDLNTQLDSLRTQNPRAFVNKMAASGQYRAGDIPATSPTGQDIQSAADRISQRAQLQEEGQVGPDGNSSIGSRTGRLGGLAQQVAGEMQPGYNPGGVPGLLGRGLEAMGKMGGAMGSAARMAGPIAGAAGLGLAAYGAVQGAGGIYQDYKNMGSVRGGGAAEGMGYEMGIRAMAMNPFISSDQSRQIIQQGLREGYTGKEFDTVASMVASNLKDMNMEIGQSFAILRKNVQEGGMSEAALGAALGDLKGLSKTGTRSLPELIAGYQNTSGALIGMGVGGAAASQAALVAGQSMSDTQVGKDSGEQLVAAMTSDPMGLAQMRNTGAFAGKGSVSPQAIPFLMDSAGEGEQLAAASFEVIKKYAMQYWNGFGKPKKGTNAWGEAIARWQMYLVQARVPWANDRPTVIEWFDKITAGRNPMTEGKERTEEQTEKSTEVKGRNIIDRAVGSTVSSLSAAGNEIGSFVGNVFGTAKDVLTSNTENIDDRWKNWNEKSEDRYGAIADQRGGYRSEALANIQRTYGSRGYEIVKDGKVVQFDQSNQDQMNQLSKGELKWRQKGASGDGYTLAETKGLTGDALKSAMGGGSTSVTGSVEIGLTEEAKRLLKPTRSSVTLTPHEQQANAGQGQATPNNAALGEGPRR